MWIVLQEQGGTSYFPPRIYNYMSASQFENLGSDCKHKSVLFFNSNGSSAINNPGLMECLTEVKWNESNNIHFVNIDWNWNGKS